MLARVFPSLWRSPLACINEAYVREGIEDGYVIWTKQSLLASQGSLITFQGLVIVPLMVKNLPDIVDSIKGRFIIRAK